MASTLTIIPPRMTYYTNLISAIASDAFSVNTAFLGEDLYINMIITLEYCKSGDKW
jgi:hypothetical protein